MHNAESCEHWDERDWERYCTIVAYPKTSIAQDDMVEIRGLNVPSYKGQLVASMWTKEYEIGDCEGGWSVDDIGLGKVCA